MKRKIIKELTGVYNSTPSSENLGSLVGEANQLRKNLATDLTPPSSTTQQTTNPQTYNQPTTGVQDPNIGITNGSSGGVTSVPAPEEPIDEYTTKTINTVPIGIAIGATGIVGSIGAVVVNEKYGRKNKNKELEEVDDDVFDNDNDDNYYQKDEENIEYDASPYMASRQQREVDRYYGNEIRLEEDDDFKEADKDKGDYYE